MMNKKIILGLLVLSISVIASENNLREIKFLEYAKAHSIFYEEDLNVEGLNLPTTYSSKFRNKDAASRGKSRTQKRNQQSNKN